MGRHLVTGWLPFGEAVEASGRVDDQGGRVALGREIAEWNRKAATRDRVQVLRRKGGKGSIERVEAKSLARMLAAKAARQVTAANCPEAPDSSGGQISEGGQASSRRRRATKRPAGLRRWPADVPNPFDGV